MVHFVWDLFIGCQSSSLPLKNCPRWIAEPKQKSSVVTLNAYPGHNVFFLRLKTLYGHVNKFKNMIFLKGRSLPEWICGEVRVKGLLTVQGHHVCVPGVNEDVGPTMDGGQGRTWHHLHSNTIITVHHAADDLNLQSNDSFGSQIQEWKKVSLRANACGTYPCYSSVSIIAQEVAGKCESLHLCVYVGQREDPSCRVKQGPGVTKAS